MIKQISLMSKRAYEGRFLSDNLDGPIEELPKENLWFRERLDQQYFGALTELNQALSEGYEIKHTSPFTQGYTVIDRGFGTTHQHTFDYRDEGTHYLLYKADDEGIVT